MNNTRRTIVKNAGFLMSAQVITWILAIFFTIFISRYLGAENLGKLQLANSIWGIFSILISFGTEILLMKEISRQPEKTGELTSTSNVVRTTLFLFSFIFVVIYANLVNYPQDTIRVIFVVGISALIIQIAGTYQAALQGLERMEFFSLSDVLSKFINTILTIVLLILGYRVMMVAGVMILSSLISFGVQYIAVRRLQPIKFKVNWTKAIWMLKAGFPYLLVSGFLAIYTQLDVVILSLILNEKSIGWYGAANRLFSTLLFVPAVFITAVFPALSRMYVNESNNLTLLLQKSFNLLLLLGIPIGLGVFAIAHPIVLLLYGNEFSNSGPILAIMGLVIIFTYQNALIGRYFISIDKQNIWTVVMGVAIFSTIPLDLFLIPWCQEHFSNGAMGGGISFLITEAGMLATGVILLPRGTLGNENIRLAIRATLAGLVMAAVAWPLRELFILIPILAGGLTYIGMILILRAIPKEDWKLLQLMLQSVLARFHKPKTKNPA